MSEQYSIEQKCGWKGVLTREKCIKCEGYDSQCPDIIDDDAPEQEAVRKYNNIKE